MTLLTSVPELLAHGELVDVRYSRLFAETLESPREGFDSDDVHQNLGVQFGATESVIEVRVEATVQTRIAEYQVTGAVQFHLEDGYSFAEELVPEFAEKVGVMAVYPYLREAVQSLTTRLHENPVTMPLMRQAGLSLAEPAAIPE